MGSAGSLSTLQFCSVLLRSVLARKWAAMKAGTKEYHRPYLPSSWEHTG